MKTLAEMMGEWDEIKTKLSPWPWRNVPDGEGGFVVIHSELDDEKHDVCYSSLTEVFETDLENMNFIGGSPQNFDIAMQALKEAVEIIKALEVVSVKRFSDGKEFLIQDWLRKYGFEEMER